MNNETIGISAEVAIADTFDVWISPTYRVRGEEEIAGSIREIVYDIFVEKDIPIPVRHTAENQNSIDFELENGETLSVKTNQKTLGKVAPQIIGQPTSETYFDFLDEKLGFDVYRELRRLGLPDTYQNRAYIFKRFSMENICTMLDIYWQHLFECDHYLHFYNILNRDGTLSHNPKYIVLKDLPTHPAWDRSKISFTRSIDTWNECNVVKYDRISMGEFQAHNNRNCLKFRFNIKGILKLLERGLI